MIVQLGTHIVLAVCCGGGGEGLLGGGGGGGGVRGGGGGGGALASNIKSSVVFSAATVWKPFASFTATLRVLPTVSTTSGTLDDASVSLGRIELRLQRHTPHNENPNEETTYMYTKPGLRM